MDDVDKESKYERRDRKKLAKKNKIQHHGKGLAMIYKNAILKRQPGPQKLD